jgi:mevalonate kinase
MIKTSAPGSIMLMGEHAVLQGKQAIVAAIAQRVYVDLVPRIDKLIRIHSPLFGDHQTELPIKTLTPPFQFVLAAIKCYEQYCDHGFDLTITSDINPTYGLGSSAAVTVATLYALAHFTQQTLSKELCHQQAHQIIQHIQGSGSGADVVASCWGGITAYRIQPYDYQTLTAIPDLQLFYAGYKTSTATVIASVQARQNKYPSLFEKIYKAMDHCCREAVTAWQQADWRTVATLMIYHQHLQAALGTSDTHLNRMIECLQSIDGILAAKISGSGLGDCVLSIGSMTDPTAGVALMHTLPGVQMVETAITQYGVQMAATAIIQRGVDHAH